MKDMIEIAKKKAGKSTVNFKISAIGFDRKGNYLGSACNCRRFDHYGGGLHAEMALLHKFGPRIKSMLICRVGKSGNLLPIDPCHRCQRVLDKLKIKVKTIR